MKKELQAQEFARRNWLSMQRKAEADQEQKRLEQENEEKAKRALFDAPRPVFY